MLGFFCPWIHWPWSTSLLSAFAPSSMATRYLLSIDFLNNLLDLIDGLFFFFSLSLFLIELQRLGTVFSFNQTRNQTTLYIISFLRKTVFGLLISSYRGNWIRIEMGCYLLFIRHFLLSISRYILKTISCLRIFHHYEHREDRCLVYLL